MKPFKISLYSAAAMVLIAGLTAFSVSEYIHKKNGDESSVLPMLYQQRAGEYRALCLQAYHWAHSQAQDEWDKATPEQKKHLAIVTDLDETALDNTPGEAFAYKNDIPFDLFNWWLHGKPGAVPGAVDFFNWANQKGFHIYYISNRADAPAVIDSTRTQMYHLGFPQTKTADFDQYFLFSHNKQSTKQPRRDSIASHFHDKIILLLGDNLGDIQTAFDREHDVVYLADSIRCKLVDKFNNNWGHKYIVFPNAYYGDWEGAFSRDYQLAHHDSLPGIQDKYAMREALLKTYDFTKK